MGTLNIIHEDLLMWEILQPQSNQPQKRQNESAVLEASASSPQTKRRRLDVLESEDSHSEPICSTSEECVLTEDSGTETIRLSDANLDVEEEEAVLGLDINHENDDLTESEVDGNNEVDSTTNLLKKADDFWNNYLQENNTVVANSFQGMYKSTVSS